MHISVPASAGGCGASHSRTVTRGAPDKAFRLDCPSCEGYLKGDRKQRILKTTPGDPKAGIPAKQERVADADPLWSSTPDSVPLTPDEAAVNHVRAERGSQQIQMLQALAAIRATGVNVPVEAMWLLEKELPAGILYGTMLCVNGHDNAAGAKFCAECGAAMNARAQVEAAPEAVIPLDRLHVQTLRKMCREKDLPDKGTKDEMIMRLEAA
jgi:hypothetical protein